MELRLAAIVADDENMKQAFRRQRSTHHPRLLVATTNRKKRKLWPVVFSGAKRLSNYAAGMGVRLSEKEAGRTARLGHRILGNREVAQKVSRYQTVPVVCLSCAFRSQICEGIVAPNRTIRANSPFKVLVRRFCVPQALCGSTLRVRRKQDLRGRA